MKVNHSNKNNPQSGTITAHKHTKQTTTYS